jgi:hypothetical protein
MTLAMHLCRGSFRAPTPRRQRRLAEALLKEMDLDAYFLEYDDARSGDFRPLRFLPKGKTVVLGLVTPSSADGDKDELRAASRPPPSTSRSTSSLSPQCGFSSTVHGSNIAVEAQRAGAAGLGNRSRGPGLTGANRGEVASCPWALHGSINMFAPAQIALLEKGSPSMRHGALRPRRQLRARHRVLRINPAPVRC